MRIFVASKVQHNESFENLFENKVFKHKKDAELWVKKECEKAISKVDKKEYCFYDNQFGMPYFFKSEEPSICTYFSIDCKYIK